MAIQFSQKAFGTSFGIAICIALSAVGNLIAVVYTYSRVKQAMAVQNFMPFSKFLKQNKDYPIGGIILHWVVTVVTIVAIPNSADGYSFVLGIFPYGHTIIAIFTGLGFCWINSSVKATERSRYGAGGWIADFSWWNQRYNRCAIALVFILLNLIVIVCAPQQQQGDPDIVPRYLWPVVFFAVEGGAASYWAILMAMSTNYFDRIWKFRAVLYTPGESRGENQGWSRYPGEQEESRLDGSRRRVHIEVRQTLLSIFAMSRTDIKKTSNHRYDPLKDAVEGTKSFFYDYIW
ncbi:High affinity methionine permease [Neofusicoccum parvum]|uniref:High affinity methionine permease n=1 Tax=Neofusicoccum parvum TaxID=310453 RepID=A0ACB5S5H9_9PEZI|nr:High affinity methionine permease [Neofusicoccum parvum]